MIRLLPVLALLAAPVLAEPPIAYPPTATVAQVDSYFGERVADPYRWLENDVRQDPRVAAWVAEQNKVTDAYLATLPARAIFAERLRTLINYERRSVPRKAGTRYFYLRNPGLDNQASLWLREGASGSDRLLLNPNSWSKDGATALAEWEPSRDGRLLAYAVQDGGTDWRVVRVLDVATGQPLADELRWVKFSGLSWRQDGTGFYYSRFPEPAGGAQFQSLNLNHSVWFHRLGTPQSADVQVFATPARPKLNHSATVTDDGRWLVINSSEGTDPREEVTLVDLRTPNARPRTLIPGFANRWELAGAIGDRLWFVTDKEAARGAVVEVDAASGATKPTVPEGRDKLDRANVVGGRLVLSYLRDVKSAVEVRELDGRMAASVPLPGIGAADGFAGRADDAETYFSFTSFATPATVYRYDVATNQAMPWFAPQVAFDPARYRVEQRFYASKDGTRIPLFVVRRADISRPSPTLLYGYGGFDVSLTPYFSATRLAWLEQGGVLAVANLRGGGEYGRAWHEAGKRANKQNVFDDFIAAGEYLQREGITGRDQLAIQGGSNGGLLIGAVVNQRPELFAAALPQVGVMDMLRFNQFTAGRYWVDDYGDPGVAADYRVLRAYSPYHNVRAPNADPSSAYPAILISTADTDDRVVPGHSFKYAAALQASNLGPKPRLIQIETRAGHGSGKPTDKLIEETADQWAFIAHWTGLPVRANP